MSFPRRTPFYHQHAAVGATFAAAWSFAGTPPEHNAARQVLKDMKAKIV